MPEEKDGLPQDYNTFVELLKANKDNPDELQSIIGNTLDLFQNHYDSGRDLGRIAETIPESYEKLIIADGHDEVNHAICGPIHQIAASALNDAGIEAAVFNGISVRSSGGSGHAVLLYSVNPGKYVLSDYGHSFQIEADDFIDACEKSMVYSDRFMPDGKLKIISHDGEHQAYTEFNIGHMLPKNHDKNSVESLRAPFDILNTKNIVENGHNIDYSTTSGTDKIYGTFNTNSLSVNYLDSKETSKGYEKTWRTELGVDNLNISNEKNFKGEFSTSSIYIDENGETFEIEGKTYKTNETIENNYNYKVAHINYDQQIKTPELINNNDNISAKGFLHGNAQGYLSLASGKNISKTTLDIERLDHQPAVSMSSPAQCKNKIDGDLSFGMMSGLTTKLRNTDKSNIGINVMAGERMVYDSNVFTQFPKPALETVTGAEIYGKLTKTPHKWAKTKNLGYGSTYSPNNNGWEYGVDGKASVFKVDAKYYDKTSTSLGLRGYAKNNKNDVSVYYENTNEAVKLHEHRGIHKDNSQIFGAEWNTTIINKPNRNASIGFKGEYEKANTGENFSGGFKVRIGF